MNDEQKTIRQQMKRLKPRQRAALYEVMVLGWIRYQSSVDEAVNVAALQQKCSAMLTRGQVAQSIEALVDRGCLHVAKTATISCRAEGSNVLAHVSSVALTEQGRSFYDAIDARPMFGGIDFEAATFPWRWSK